MIFSLLYSIFMEHEMVQIITFLGEPFLVLDDFTHTLSRHCAFSVPFKFSIYFSNQLINICFIY